MVGNTWKSCVKKSGRRLEERHKPQLISFLTKAAESCSEQQQAGTSPPEGRYDQGLILIASIAFEIGMLPVEPRERGSLEANHSELASVLQCICGTRSVGI